MTTDKEGSRIYFRVRVKDQKIIYNDFAFIFGQKNEADINWTDHALECSGQKADAFASAYTAKERAEVGLFQSHEKGVLFTQLCLAASVNKILIVIIGEGGQCQIVGMASI